MKSPISIQFVAAGALSYGKYALARFKPARTGESPNWDGRGGAMNTRETGQPITDRAYWAGRYALCTLDLRKEDGTRLTIPDAIVAVSRERRIVSTDIVGRNGTVKEYINEGDWQLNIVLGIQAVRSGVITDDYPAEELKALRKFLDEPKAIEVASEFLKIFDITRIVVKSVSLTQETHANYQEVNISAVSDETYEIFSTEYEPLKLP